MNGPGTDPDLLAPLLKRARVCGLSQNSSLAAPVRELVAAADGAKRPFTASELALVCATCGSSKRFVQELMDQADALVDAARACLLRHEPQLVRPGGQLYPAHRAVACWRDCAQFLRVIVYAVACGCPAVSDGEGVQALLALYALMDVPLPALRFALASLRQQALAAMAGAGCPADLQNLDQAFADLLKALQHPVKSC